ncbi:MAG TPA: ferric reductase-like transmembrane domain-containing protein [Acidimicrobiales bacterium]|jgi:DMSO/TMAO reductase YedYZ heme-binding membrane subunit|nr:ferric reductase-like transmembrane domain-containing protein [Acidimicrobiales bacterium]
MSPQLWWHIARATGIVAWTLLAAAVVWGLLLSTRLARGRPTPAWLLDLHRFLGASAVAFTAVHLAGLVADNYVHFDIADLLVPYAAAWRPGPVALGVVSLYLLAVVEGTSLAMRRIPRRAWRSVHLTSYVLFWSATFHFILAGTDAPNPLARAGIDLVAALVVFLTLVRILDPRGRTRQQARRGEPGRDQRSGPTVPAARPLTAPGRPREGRVAGPPASRTPHPPRSDRGPTTVPP